MTGKRIGYIRVSTLDQNPDRQLEGIQLDKKFIEYASASSTNRPQLQLMLEFVREDDLVIVHSMDRLARNLFDLKKIVNIIVEKRAEIHFAKEQLTFNGSHNPMAMLLLSLMGALAEFELSFIRERQREGIALAKKQGKYRGGKTKLTQEKIEIIKQEMTTRNSKLSIAKKIDVSPPTLYNYIKKLGLK